MSQRTLILDAAVQRLRDFVPEGWDLGRMPVDKVKIPAVLVGIGDEDADVEEDETMRRYATITFGVRIVHHDFNALDDFAERVSYELENDMGGFHPQYVATSFDNDDEKARNYIVAQVDFQVRVRRFGT